MQNLQVFEAWILREGKPWSVLGMEDFCTRDEVLYQGFASYSHQTMKGFPTLESPTGNTFRFASYSHPTLKGFSTHEGQAGNAFRFASPAGNTDRFSTSFSSAKIRHLGKDVV